MSAGFESRSRMRSKGNQPVQPIAVAWNLDPSTPRPLDAQAGQPVECGESVGIREYAGDAGRSSGMLRVGPAGAGGMLGVGAEGAAGMLSVGAVGAAGSGGLPASASSGLVAAAPRTTFTRHDCRARPMASRGSTREH